MISQLTIIAATNYSETAANAVNYAAEIAKAVGAKLVLFNSFSLSVHSANSLISASEMQKQLDKAVSRLDVLGRATAALFHIEVSTFCSYSFLEDELISIIDTTGADLIVMGMAERSFAQELLGNSTTSVIKNINFPVLAVPKNAHFHKLKKILYASDSVGWSSIKKFSWIRNIAEPLGTEIEIFNVNNSIKELKEEHSIRLTGEEELEDVKYIYKSVRSNAVIEEIKKEIKKYNADILVMMPRKYGFWDSLVHISKTRIMAAGMEIPLLSIPNY
ncbi:universal stress protein [Flavobacterium pectinovorum]|uniref:universal stress protein n=1 Tax=Flavobacterium pectinovorum TaxID=29533 RepID=UPI001FABB1D4|nr:universal stress protein [Flavobacterium pectinovorum]MCI9845522.1 universal stress protein [Flavobacterium pectinovorum]